MVRMSELMVWKISTKSLSSFIRCWLRLQHSLCTWARISFLMFFSLVSEQRRGLGVKGCAKKGCWGSAVSPEREWEGGARP